MMGRIYTYTPSDVVLTISGYVVPDITSVDVEWNADKFTMVRGIRGQNTRVRNLDTSCKIRLSVLQTSIVNQLFSEIVTLDGSREGDDMILANLQVMLKDTGGSSNFVSNNCYITNYAPFGFTDALQDRQWMIQCLDTSDVLIGGSQKPAKDIF